MALLNKETLEQINRKCSVGWIWHLVDAGKALRGVALVWAAVGAAVAAAVAALPAPVPELPVVAGWPKMRTGRGRRCLPARRRGLLQPAAVGSWRADSGTEPIVLQYEF